jgi:valyl-tRNA synthetase
MSAQAMSSTELPKTYEPSAVEAAAYQTWLEARSFHGDPGGSGEGYSIVIPPPNVTGALHLGHAINNTLQDILVRKARMEGKAAVWIPGVDHAGIATQAVVEKQLKEKENKTRHDVGREGLVERIWQWKQQYGDRIVEQLKRLGCSCDWDRLRFTLDEQCAAAVRETFFKLFKDGLVFRGKRLVNWDTHLQTSISDDEIYYEPVKTFLWHIKYPIVDSDGATERRSDEGGEEEARRGAEARRHEGTEARSGGEGEGGKWDGGGRPGYLVVATTRPETMLGDTAVAVNSQDLRWQWAIGKFVKLPLTGRLIPIIADDILVDPKFGTGCVKVTPAHDPNDYAVWQRHQGKSDQIDIINILNPDGTLNENAGAYKGLKREVSRKKVIEELTHQGFLIKEEPYETQVGHSDRSKTAIEPYLSDQWFVHMAPLAEPALEVVREGLIKFHPERHAHQYLAWLGEKRDWPISRQLWWGHRIPVWRGRISVLGGRTDFENINNTSSRTPITVFIKEENGQLKAHVVAPLEKGREEALLAGYEEVLYSARPTDDGLPEFFYCPAAGSRNAEVWLDKIAVRDPDVLDTWFSSALWPHSTLGWPAKTPELAKWNPTSVLVTGRDIITLWVARMVMFNLYNMSDEATKRRSDEGMKDADSIFKPGLLAQALEPLKTEKGSSNPSSLRRSVASSLAIPFLDVAINPTILDGKGERMSKSKGNGVDPVDIIETHGADALRFTLTTMATETQDVRLPVKKMANGKNTSEKFDLGRNFCNKLWNASRFALANLEQITTEAQRHGGASASTGASSCLCGSVVSSLSLADKWVLSRLARTVAECNEALRNYRFDIYAKSCYDFFWRDFCDWYVEVVKPVLKDPAAAGASAGVLALALDQSLRLMHPMIPFITETIWARLSEVWPQRSMPGVAEAPASKLLISAAWPTVGASLVNEAAEREFTLIQDVIVAIRNVRNEHKVDVKRSVQTMIAAGDAAVALLLANRGTIELLASCSLVEVKPGVQGSASAVRTTASGCEIFLEGLVDADAEKQRVARRREELAKLVATLKGRLSNEGYIAKAPAKLVEQTQAQLAEAEAELSRL